MKKTKLKTLLLALLMCVGGGVNLWGDVVRPTYVDTNVTGYTNETASCLVDGSGTSTKWCGTFQDPTWITVQANNTILTGYELYNGNDTQSYSSRRWKSWKVEGSNDYSTWTTIQTVTDANMSTTNYGRNMYVMENNTTQYNYYRFTITAIEGGSVFQMSDLQLITDCSSNQGVWRRLGWSKVAATDASWSYNKLTGTEWGGSWSFTDDVNGLHVYNNCTSSGNTSSVTHMIFHILAHAPLTAPSYCKVTRSATVDIYAQSSGWASYFQLYFFDTMTDACTTVRNANGDATGRSLYLRRYGETWGSSGNATTTYTCDNSEGTSEKTVDKYLLVTGDFTNGNREIKYCGQEGGFRNQGNKDTYIYYKHITFDANGGTGSIAKQTIEDSGTLTQNNNAMTRDGYVFKGWNTSADGSGTFYADGNLIEATSDSKGPVTLYAQWSTEPTLAFSHAQLKGYQKNGNYNSCNFSDLSYTTSNSDWYQSGNVTSVGNAVVLSTKNQNVLKRYNKGWWSGDAFDWFSLVGAAPSYTKVDYEVNAKIRVSHGNNGCEARAAFFDYGTESTKWSARNQDPKGTTCFQTASRNGQSTDYTTYNGEAAAAYEYQTTSEISTNKTITLSVDNHNGSASLSNHWYGGFTSSHTNAAVNTNPDSWTYLDMQITSATCTYYKYITFNANGGSGSINAQTIENSGNLTANTITRTGYTFAGWNTAEDGSGTNYSDGGVITATATDKGPVTLYAVWSKKSNIDSEGAVKYEKGHTVTPEDVNKDIEDKGTGETATTKTAFDLSNTTVTADNAKTIVENIRKADNAKNAFIFLPKVDNLDPTTKAKKNVITTDGTNNTCQNLELVDGTPMVTALVGKSFTATNASYKRNVSNNWGTICLPYAVKSDATIQYYKLRDTQGTEGTLYFEKVDEVAANTPAAFYQTNPGEIAPTATNAAIAIQSNENNTGVSYYLVGTYKGLTLQNTQSDCFYIAQNKFWCADQSENGVTIPAYRAYITKTNPNVSTAKASSLSISIWDGNEATAIGTIDANGNINVDGVYPELSRRAPAYNLAGQRVNNNAKGILIINGKKIIK